MIKDSNAVILITEKAIEAEKVTGIVTSVPVSDATPAAFSVHYPNSNAYAEIARSQLIDSKLSVLMGCGNPEWDADGMPSSNSYQYIGGKEVWDSLKNNATSFNIASPQGNTVLQDIDGDNNPDAWFLIQDSIQFAEMKSGTTPKRVLGIPKSF